MRAATASILLSTAVACGSETDTDRPTWSELFTPTDSHGKRIWSGGDGAYTVPIDGDRTLWLFGDTYLTEVENGERVGRADVVAGNTAAILATATGPRPTARLDFAHDFDWGARAALPSAQPAWMPLLLRESDLPGESTAREAAALLFPIFHWPAHGVRIENDLLLFNHFVTPKNVEWVPESCPVETVCDSNVEVGVKLHGSTLTVISEVDGADFSDWGKGLRGDWASERVTQRWVPASGTPTPRCSDDYLQWGLSVVHFPEGSSTYHVFGSRRAGRESQVVLARVTNVLAADDFFDPSRWQYWTESGWTGSPTELAAIATNTPLEFSVSRVPYGEFEGSFALVHSGNVVDGECTPRIEVRIAPTITGPYEADTRTYVYEMRRECGEFVETPLVYGGRAHPELSGAETLLVSFVRAAPIGRSSTLCLDVDGTCVPFSVATSTEYYTPKFLRIPWKDVAGATSGRRVPCPLE